VCGFYGGVIGEPRCVHSACAAAGVLQGHKRSTGDDLRVVNDAPLSAWADRDRALTDQSVR